MDTTEGNTRDPLSLHKYLYCQGNPVNCVDPSGESTLLVISDADNPGSFDQRAADKAAEHFRKAGWTIRNVEAGDFVNIDTQFDGVIFTGHGDATQAAAITVDVLQSRLKLTKSTLQVAMALTCHGFDFISNVGGVPYCTQQALIVGYWGYSMNTPGRSYRVGRVIDKWLADPTYTCDPIGNILQDAVGIGICDVLRPGFEWFENSIISNMDL